MRWLLQVFFSATLILLPFRGQQQNQKGGGRSQAPPAQPTPDEKRQIQSKLDDLDTLVRNLKAKHVIKDLVADVEIFAKAGHWALEFPEEFFNHQAIERTIGVLDKGLERARYLQAGRAPWREQKGRVVHGFYSALDGSVQLYGVTIPDSYDGTRPVRLYVWLHGRSGTLTEVSFIDSFPNGKTGVPDVGQIQLDVYGRWNGNGYHMAGEADVFEAIADVEARYKIDPNRILLRGFSLGGEGAWHLALQNPDRWAAAEIGAGTWPRRSQMPGFPPYQEAALRIYENMMEWALNAFNLPLAGHDGDSDTQVASIPVPEQGTPTRGQLESSIRVREQLAKEGYPPEGQPNDLKVKGVPAIFLISEHTGHGTSPLVRERLNAFLEEYGDRGQISPDHIRFLTYTTRYNQSYWVSLDELAKHYERAEVDAQRSDDGKTYEITTKNLTRLSLRETGQASQIRIDGQSLRVKPAPQIVLEKSGPAWRVARSRELAGLHKTHALQGPIDDAFLDPFLLVRPTEIPWNDAANRQALRTLARFDRLYAKNFRAHPRVKDDRDVTEEDIEQYNLVLFGDPGSNRWIAKILEKLPFHWTRETVSFGNQSFPAAGHLPALVYPNPLKPSHYVVLNTGLTISDREYNADYSMPRLGDFAILKINEGADVPDTAYAGLFDESWKLPQP